MKATSWPENAWPTAEQWLEWLLSNDRDDQLQIAERALASHQTAHQCFIADHEGALEQVRGMGQRMLDSYQEGWVDGLKKFGETYEAARAEEDA